MAKNASIGEMLKAPFEEEDLIFDIDIDSIEEEATGAYVALETVEPAVSAAYDRLDEVFGIDGWELFVDPLMQAESAKGFRCQIRAYFPNSRVITKTGVGVSESGNTNEALKNAFLSSIRLFGVGRYLDLEPERWLPVDNEGNPIEEGVEEGGAGDDRCAGEQDAAGTAQAQSTAPPSDPAEDFVEPVSCDDPIPFPSGSGSSSHLQHASRGQTRRRRDLPKPQRIPGYRSNAR